MTTGGSPLDEEDDGDTPAERHGQSDGPSPESSGRSAAQRHGGDTAAEATADSQRSKSLDEKYCSSCGEIIKQAAELCPECGVRHAGVPRSSQEKDPGVAALLSAVTGGWGGQFYNDQIGKGLALLVVQFFNFLLLTVLVGFVTGLLVWVIGTYDAYRVAAKRTD